ncbi:MAG: hypothetical protein VB934_02785, partial [Polyangiaceae bacterium]
MTIPARVWLSLGFWILFGAACATGQAGIQTGSGGGPPDGDPEPACLSAQDCPASDNDCRAAQCVDGE